MTSVQAVVGASLLIIALLLGFPVAASAEEPLYGPELQGFDYPWPVHDFAFSSQGEAMTMRYMDVSPTGAPNGRTAVSCTARTSARRPGSTRSVR